MAAERTVSEPGDTEEGRGTASMATKKTKRCSKRAKLAKKKAKKRKKRARKKAQGQAKKQTKKRAPRREESPAATPGVMDEGAAAVAELHAERDAESRTTQRAVQRAVQRAEGQADQHEDAVEESVPAPAVQKDTPVDTRPGRLALEVFTEIVPCEAEVATRVAAEGGSIGSAEAEALAARLEAGGPERVEPLCEAPPDDEAPAAPDPYAPEHCASDEQELSPEEALAMLADISGGSRSVEPASGEAATGRRHRRQRPPGSVVMPSCRVLAFESGGVAPEMRVAATAVARLYDLATTEGLDLELGRICQTLDELVGAWDDTPLGQSVVLLVNLMGAGNFLDEVVDELPETEEAYWIVFETLRGEVTSASSEFLARQRDRRRAKAIGFGPRNVVAAARSGAEAVRWRVEWGYGGRFAAARAS